MRESPADYMERLRQSRDQRRTQRVPPKMDDDQFQQWAVLLEHRTGMMLPVERKSFLITNLGLRMHEIGHESFQSYFDYINLDDPEQQEWNILVDRLTVHETRFFRHKDSLDLIQIQWLTPLLSAVESNTKLSIMSVGCSTGEEAYTVAMIIDDAIQASTSTLAMDWQMKAVDISSPCLMHARQGKYYKRQLIDMPHHFQARYGSVVDKQYWQVNEWFRQKIQFLEMNLLHIQQTIQPKVHLIICQNVLIYFNRQRCAIILDELVKCLLPGGLLVLAPGEMVGWQHPLLEKNYYKNAVAFCRLDDSDTEGN